MERVVISASIVLYEEDINVLTRTIDSFLSISITKRLFLIDNTENSKFKNKFDDKNIVYLANGKNIGFGSGHNKTLPLIKDFSSYHLVLNPDVYFNPEVLSKLINELEKDHSLAMIAPKALFPDGSHQFSCRRYPKILELAGRRFSIIKPFLVNLIDKGQYKDMDLNQPFYCEYLAGCFQLYKTNDFIKLNGFDERYFLYMEDVDICRKIDELGKRKMYYPLVKIHHILKQGSLRRLNLFFRHLSSAIKYYKKWGFK